jgi:4'-phosphopantetheinyl transferase EntD
VCLRGDTLVIMAVPTPVWLSERLPCPSSPIAGVLPAEIAWSEAYEDRDDVVTFAEEDAGVSSAVRRRQREYRAVRHCARETLASLGRAPVPILSGAKREPLWPVGSLTHCQGYRGAVNCYCRSPP